MGVMDVNLLRFEMRHVEQTLLDITGKRMAVRRAIKGAVARTTRWGRTRISKLIRDKVAIKKSAIDKTIKAKPFHKAIPPTGRIVISETARIPLKEFGARQNKAGVKYRIEKGGPFKLIPGAFTVARFGEHAFKRKGRERLPIQKLHGPSPWGVFLKGGIEEQALDDVGAQLRKNLQDTIRVALLRKNGTIGG